MEPEITRDYILKEIRQLKIENEFLKKESELIRPERELIDKEDANLSVSRQCELLWIKAVWVYYMPLQHPESQDFDLRLSNTVDAGFCVEALLAAFDK